MYVCIYIYLCMSKPKLITLPKVVVTERLSLSLPTPLCVYPATVRLYVTNGSSPSMVTKLTRSFTVVTMTSALPAGLMKTL